MRTHHPGKDRQQSPPSGKGSCVSIEMTDCVMKKRRDGCEVVLSVWKVRLVVELRVRELVRVKIYDAVRSRLGGRLKKDMSKTEEQQRLTVVNQAGNDRARQVYVGLEMLEVANQTTRCGSGFIHQLRGSEEDIRKTCTSEIVTGIYEFQLLCRLVLNNAPAIFMDLMNSGSCWILSKGSLNITPVFKIANPMTKIPEDDQLKDHEKNYKAMIRTCCVELLLLKDLGEYIHYGTKCTSVHRHKSFATPFRSKEFEHEATTMKAIREQKVWNSAVELVPPQWHAAGLVLCDLSDVDHD
ncbi:hypothetical protein Tco_0206161 [Tanacetum coccineum]